MKINMHLLREDLILESSQNVFKGDPKWIMLFDLTEELTVEQHIGFFIEATDLAWKLCQEKRSQNVMYNGHAIGTSVQVPMVTFLKDIVYQLSTVTYLLHSFLC